MSSDGIKSEKEYLDARGTNFGRDLLIISSVPSLSFYVGNAQRTVNSLSLNLHCPGCLVAD